MNIKIGSDPEVFLVNDKGEFVSAYGFLEGTKHKPTKTRFGAVQVDGHALEFNTVPTDDVDEFIYYVTQGLKYLGNLASEKGLQVSLNPVARFNPQVFDEMPMEALKLGCDPDFNGLTGDINRAPEITFEPIRTSSGHIHVGWTNDKDPFEASHFATCLRLTQFVGPKLEALGKTWEIEDSITRRRYYGANYSFRPKPYGYEARQLDGLWMASEDNMAAVFRCARSESRAALQWLLKDAA